MTDVLSDVLGACHCFGGTDGMSPWGDDLEVPQTRNDTSSGRRRGRGRAVSRGRSVTRRTRCINAKSDNIDDSNDQRDNSMVKMEELQQQTSTSYWPLKNTMFRPPAADATTSTKSRAAVESKTRPSLSPHHATGRNRKKTRDNSSHHGRRRHHAPWRNRRSLRRGSSLPAVSKQENNCTDDEEDNSHDDDRDSSPVVSTRFYDSTIALNDHEVVVRVSTSRSRSRSRTSTQRRTGSRRLSKQRSNSSIVKDNAMVPPSSVDVATPTDEIIAVGTTRKRGIRRKSNGGGGDDNNASITSRQSISERLRKITLPRPFARRSA
eukprot:CAMPEP_0113524030 /NCGR_PEP_ID=MMETSP0014_2-20120614/46009_1 /TAXON_ID=2857 /ORGANISM="Nitzschia sp." /LENGTH=320 /DNA_ID=CAMNT_0000422135 /DNA_START=250 /DNA_END=1208 /DNA_ORIENTATION=- /assembly_acc=CAM_ASM_000159